MMYINLERSHAPAGGIAGLSSLFCHASAMLCLSVIQDLNGDILIVTD